MDCCEKTNHPVTNNHLYLYEEKQMMPNYFDTVKLRDGRIGAVVEVYDDGKAFEVEFLDDDGYTDSVESIESSEIELVVWKSPSE